MTVAEKQKRGFRLFGSRNRHPDQAITEYHLEDIRADEPIYIAPGAIVAGDIYAPRVVIAGLVCGFVVSLAVEMESGAEIWGDVYTSELHLDTAVKLNGWVSTLNREEYRALRQSDTELGLWIANRSDPTLNALPDELQQNVQDTIAAMPPGRVNVLRRLQLEIGMALVARTELEQGFEERVQEIAGESLSQASRLREQIAALTAEQTTQTERINQLQTRLQNRDKELADEKQKLIEAQALIDQQVSRLEEFETKSQMQEQDILHLRQEISRLEEILTQMRLQADEAQERTNNLEIALQSSLQRSADLDEALLRWQELAEANEEKVRELESQTESTVRQAQEQTNSLAVIRDQRDRFEREWEDAQDEIDQLTKQIAAMNTAVSEHEQVVEQVETLQAQLQRKEQDLILTKQAMVDGTAALAQSKRRVELLEQEKGEVDKQLQVAQKRVEQVTRELDTAVSRLQQSDKRGRELQLALRQAQQNKVAPDELKQLQTELADSQASHKQLKDELRTMRHQLEAHEADIEHYQQQISAQGQQLAELRMELVDKQLYLDKVLTAARKQAGELNQVKKLAGQRIRQLEQQLSKRE